MDNERSGPLGRTVHRNTGETGYKNMSGVEEVFLITG